MRRLPSPPCHLAGRPCCIRIRLLWVELPGSPQRRVYGPGRRAEESDGGYERSAADQDPPGRMRCAWDTACQEAFAATGRDQGAGDRYAQSLAYLA